MIRNIEIVETLILKDVACVSVMLVVEGEEHIKEIKDKGSVWAKELLNEYRIIAVEVPTP